MVLAEKLSVEGGGDLIVQGIRLIIFILDLMIDYVNEVMIFLIKAYFESDLGLWFYYFQKRKEIKKITDRIRKMWKDVLCYYARLDRIY